MPPYVAPSFFSAQTMLLWQDIGDFRGEPCAPQENTGKQKVPEIPFTAQSQQTPSREALAILAGLGWSEIKGSQRSPCLEPRRWEGS